MSNNADYVYIGIDESTCRWKDGYFWLKPCYHFCAQSSGEKYKRSKCSIKYCTSFKNKGDKVSIVHLLFS